MDTAPAPSRKQVNALDIIEGPIGVQDPAIKARIAVFGYEPFVSSAAEFGKFIADETEKWAKVVKFSGIEPN